MALVRRNDAVKWVEGRTGYKEGFAMSSGRGALGIWGHIRRISEAFGTGTAFTGVGIWAKVFVKNTLNLRRW